MRHGEVVTPEVGMGATYVVGSDRYPYTIVEVSKSGNRITVQSDREYAAEGYNYYSNQVFTYTPNTDGSLHILSYRKKNNVWREVGKKSSLYFYIGERRFYQDPSF